VADLWQRNAKVRANGGTSTSYHDGVYGMATAALSRVLQPMLDRCGKSTIPTQEHGRGVLRGAAHSADESRRSTGARRRSVREGEPDLDELVTRTPGGGVSKSGHCHPPKCGMGGHGAVWRSNADGAAAPEPIRHE